MKEEIKKTIYKIILRFLKYFLVNIFVVVIFLNESIFEKLVSSYGPDGMNYILMIFLSLFLIPIGSIIQTIVHIVLSKNIMKLGQKYKYFIFWNYISTLLVLFLIYFSILHIH